MIFFIVVFLGSGWALSGQKDCIHKHISAIVQQSEPYNMSCCLVYCVTAINSSYVLFELPKTSTDLLISWIRIVLNDGRHELSQ